MNLQPLHLAIPVIDLAESRHFYCTVFGGEQSTFFLLDPSGNALEFKAFKDIGQLFAS